MGKRQTTALKDIPLLAECVVSELKGGEIFALVGPLGSGKTTFVKAVGKALKIRHKITSPTFALLNRYSGKLGRKKILVYHLDLYRTKNFREVLALGLSEFWGKKHTLTFIEWADKINRRLPSKTRIIKFVN